MDGDDILDIICKQPATARFIARHMYNFFVADEAQVPAWRLTPPRDLSLIEDLEKTYFESGYDITEMLRVLFSSDSFKSESVRYAKVKSPRRSGGRDPALGGRPQGDEAGPVPALSRTQVHGHGT